MAVDPNNKYVYLANFGRNNVSGFEINPSTGALKTILRSPFAAGFSPSSVAVTPSGKFVYVANSNANNDRFEQIVRVDRPVLAAKLQQRRCSVDIRLRALKVVVRFEVLI